MLYAKKMEWLNAHSGRSADDDAQIGLPHQFPNLPEVPRYLSEPNNTGTRQGPAFLALRQVRNVNLRLRLVAREHVLRAGESATDG